ncbi:MAG: Ig-like domain-containing protein [Sneathiella sp.]
MRVIVILVLLLVIASGLFLFLRDDNPPPHTASVPTKSNDVGDESQKTQNTPKQIDEVVKKTESVTATPLTPKENAPIIVVKKTAPKPEVPAGIIAMKNPSFDVVRVDKNCGLLVAGRAEPTAKVTILASGKVLGNAFASRRGEWVFVAPEPLAPGAQEINAKALNPDNREVETSRMVIMQVPDCNKAVVDRAPALAVLAPKASEDKSEVEERVTRLLQMPEPVGNVEGAKELSVGSIDYNNEGNVALSGKGTPGNEVQVYLKNKHIGTATVDENGNWALTPENEIAAGKYNLRADQLDPKGDVISRVEIPFQRAPAEDVILAKGGLEIRAIVQPGNSLWRIARRMYGEGTEYTLIYQANENQIKDPDLIYPGQIFTLPSKSSVN